MAENQEPNPKSEVAKREEKILDFWREHKIFEKSLTKEASKGEYVFYDGPPFATGLPHYGHILASTIKDAVPRFWTMRGYRVARRWGWDCHGLPIETIVEKKLDLSSRKDIEQIGIDKFNTAARKAVLAYVSEWKKTVERIGRWVDFDGSYKTMDNSYIESVWRALAEINKKGLVYEGTRVLPYCPRCETSIAQSEIAMDQSYKIVTDTAVTVKFKIKEPEKHDFPADTYILAWTTTPWTLPGNVALAVGKDIEYVLFEQDGENLIASQKFANLTPSDPSEAGVASRVVPQTSALAPEPAELGSSDLLADGSARPPIRRVPASQLIGLEYEPVFEVPAVKTSPKKKWQILPADFVTTEDGTGVVHTAVIHGEDDYKLGVEHDLPMVPLIDPRGHFNYSAPEFLRGVYHKKSEKLVIKNLEERGLLFRQEPYEHSYPHCYRCGTPIIYYALPAWFINIQKVKPQLLELNQKIDWVPAHLKDGRFKNIIEGAPDWNISRTRYWASPLPIWKCERCGKTEFVDSLKTLTDRAVKSGNKYFVMRHGQSESNAREIMSSDVKNEHHLTKEGQAEVLVSAEELKSKDVDLIIVSDFLRTRETADLVARTLGLSQSQIVIDQRLREMDFGSFNNQPFSEYMKYITNLPDRFDVRVGGGEKFDDVRRRAAEFLYDIDRQYQNEKILIVTHEAVARFLEGVSKGLDTRVTWTLRSAESGQKLKTAEFFDLGFVPLPLNADYELDLHRPYIDQIKLKCDCGGEMNRIPEVFDCWFESAMMPATTKSYPADFVAEYIAQTRTWFYYMLVVGAILHGQEPFRHVVTTGTILAADGEKMSKSKGNFPDPWLVFNKYGVDALRFYLLSTPLMRAEDLNFSERGVDEVYKKIITRLANVHSFFKLHKGKALGIQKGLALQSIHVLDQWINFRLQELVVAVTKGMENYTLDEALRPIEAFIDDLSTWYLRRSRDRIRGGDNAAAGVLKEVLKTLAKILAPFTTFIAEEIYLDLRSPDDSESIHLSNWPEPTYNLQPSAYKPLEDMKEIRRLVSLTLEVRAVAGIRVRQPLAKLSIKKPAGSLSSDLLELIVAEVNVKEIIFVPSQTEEVVLDTALTPELEHEGQLRDLVRLIQDERKKMGFRPGEPVILELPNDSKTREVVAKVEDSFKKSVSVDEIRWTEDSTHGLRLLHH